MRFRFLALLGLCFFLVLSIFFLVIQGQSKSCKTANTDDTTVTITKSGYAPESLCIVVGTTVTWFNEDARGAWPASNAHPTHTGYPAKSEKDCLGSSFDACGVLKPGESWSFAFTELGTWAYHDHIRPSLSGVVTVVTEAEHDPSLLSRLFGNRNTGDMDTDAFNALSYIEQKESLKKLASKSPKDAWEFLKKASTKNGETIISRHEFAHLVANAGFRQNGLGGIEMCDPTFAYGCYHGYTEAYLANTGPGGLAEAEALCAETFSPESEFLAYSSCIHGLGHGLFTYANLDLDKALTLCDTLEESNRRYCYDGAFMEYSFVYQGGSVDADDPWALCESLKSQYHANCARYMPGIFKSSLGLSNEEVGNLCSTGPNETLREFCTDSFGFMAVSIFQTNVENVLEMCIGVGQDLFPRCVTAAATEMRFQQYEGSIKAASDLCGSLNAGEQEICTTHTNRIQ